MNLTYSSIDKTLKCMKLMWINKQFEYTSMAAALFKRSTTARPNRSPLSSNKVFKRIKMQCRFALHLNGSLHGTINSRIHWFLRNKNNPRARGISSVLNFLQVKFVLFILSYARGIEREKEWVLVMGF
jgi:hypothetical protein